MNCPVCQCSDVSEWSKHKSVIKKGLDTINPFHSSSVRYRKDFTTCKGCGASIPKYFECEECGTFWCGRCIRDLIMPR